MAYAGYGPLSDSGGALANERHRAKPHRPPGRSSPPRLLGTFVLVFFGCGAAVFSGGDFVATGLTFGLTVVVMAYAVGRISGGHFNPAVTLGAVLGGRLPWSQVGIYMGAQLLGGLLGGARAVRPGPRLRGLRRRGQHRRRTSSATHGSGYAWWAALLVEIVLTAIFVWVILAVTDERNEQPRHGAAGHRPDAGDDPLRRDPATGTSVNPARSIGVGVFAGTDAIVQLWLFIVAPLVGAAIAGLTYPLLFGHGADPGRRLRPQLRRRPQGPVRPRSYEAQWNQGQQGGGTSPAPRGARPRSSSGRQPSATAAARPVRRAPAAAAAARPVAARPAPAGSRSSSRRRSPASGAAAAAAVPASSRRQPRPRALPATGATPTATTTAAPRCAGPTEPAGLDRASAPADAPVHPAVEVLDAGRGRRPARSTLRVRGAGLDRAVWTSVGRLVLDQVLRLEAGSARRTAHRQPSPTRGSASIARPASAPSTPAAPRQPGRRVDAHQPHVAGRVLGVVVASSSSVGPVEVRRRPAARWPPARRSRWCRRGPRRRSSRRVRPSLADVVGPAGAGLSGEPGVVDAGDEVVGSGVGVGMTSPSIPGES